MAAHSWLRLHGECLRPFSPVAYIPPPPHPHLEKPYTCLYCSQRDRQYSGSLAFNTLLLQIWPSPRPSPTSGGWLGCSAASAASVAPWLPSCASAFVVVVVAFHRLSNFDH